MSNFFIYGLSGHGRKLYRYLKREKGNIKIIGILDIDKSKQGSFFGDSEIFHPDILLSLDFDGIYLVGRQIEEIKSFLIDNYKIDPKKIYVLGRSEYPPSIEELNVRERDTFKIIENLSKIFSLNKIEYWMDTSGLLPLFRNQKFSEFSDVDIAVDNIYAKKIVDLIFDTFDSSFKIDVIYFKDKNEFCNSGSYRQVVISKEIDIVKYEPSIVDIHFEYEINNFIYREIEGKTIKLSKEYRLEKKFINYSGLLLNVPYQSEKYLESLYGKDWRIPDDFWTNRYKDKI